MKYNESKGYSSDEEDSSDEHEHASNEEIYEALIGDDIITAVYATRLCALRRLNDEKYVDALKELKTEKGQYWLKISDCACAALDIIGAEKYTGDNITVKELIETEFYSKGKK